MNKKHIAIIGATGYTGSELVRILYHHPQVAIDLITSENHHGKLFSDVHPQFKGIVDMVLQPMEALKDYKPDLVFLGLPHGASMKFVKKYYDAGFKIIDLSGDFRLDNAETYTQWYQMEHIYPEGMDKAVFGLPEFFKKEIKNAQLVANPGCFPTGAILAIAPLLKAGMVNIDRLIIDSKTGVTGAGAKAKDVTHFPNVNDDFKPYGLKTHRHTIEMQYILGMIAETDCTVQFTPHLLPVDRGILSTIYLFPEKKDINSEKMKAIYLNSYKNAPFVRVIDELPALKKVRGSNICDVMATYDDRTNTIIAVSAIDNLVKGAAGQAVQNMNIMLDFEEDTGLGMLPLMP